jgi:dihydrofolate synthase / folylpolyglutamate synthase
VTYPEAVSRLYSLEFWGIKLGLDNIRDFTRLLGNPQDRFISVHIAGTNGKGSVTAFLDSILRAAGYRVGRYTSPHLRDFRERIHVDGRPIPRPDVSNFVERFWRLVRREQYTFFETVTAMAFDAFANHTVDLAVVEVGLGGRFDATNVVRPALSVITNIDLDHTDVLGRNRRQIALEKAGIIKEGIPVLLGPMDSSVRRVIEEVARHRDAPVWTSLEILDDNSLTTKGPLRQLEWGLPLAGHHQVANAGLALAAALILDGCGVPIAPNRMRAGLSRAHWPGRFQIGAGRPTVIYDVAHNPAGMREVVSTWQRVFGSKRPAVLFTTRADKDFRSMWRLLAPSVSRWIGCPLPHGGGIGEQEMRRMARTRSVPFEWLADAPTALRRVKECAGADGLVLVVGSHYLVGELLRSSEIDPPSGRVRRVQGLSWSEICRASRPPQRFVNL